jgi:hypothetical protein
MRLVNKGFTIFVVSLVLAAIVGTYGSDAYFGRIRTLIPATSGQRFGIIRTA